MNTELEGVAQALPDYEIRREIGRGQFGVVWQARHLQLQREVAVKQLSGPVTAQYHARFRREARILAQIDHPHVVTVYDYREHDELRLLVMEFLPGGTFADRRDGGMSVDAAIASTVHAATGLHHVHTQGILHRDIKPENLMYDRRGILKVTDFGVARGDLVDATVVNVTHAGEFFGTPAYASPEQAAQVLGESGAAIGPASDQYSLAAVLYEALSGCLTHDATGGAVALCRRRVEQDAVPLHTVAPDVDPALDAIVMKALARNPDDRFATTADFATALTSASGASAPPAPPPAAAAARHRPVGLMIGAFVIVLLIALAALFLTRRGSDAPSARARPALQLAQQWTAPTGGPVFSSPAVSGNLVVVGSDDNSVRALDAQTGAEKWNRTTEGPVRSSPTIAGGRVFIGSDDGYLYALDLATGAVVWKAKTGFNIVSTPAVASNAVVVGANQLYAFDTASGRALWTFPTKGVIVSSPAIANGIVVVGSDDKNVYGVALADGKERWHVPTGGAIQSSPVIVNGAAYVGGLDGQVYAINLATGANTWATDLGAPVKSSPAVAAGRLFVGTVAGKIVALDAASGAQQWTYTAQNRANSSPAIVGALVVIGTDDDNVYAIDAASGALAGRFKTGGAVGSSPAPNGRGVVVGSDDGMVYAITGLPAS